MKNQYTVTTLLGLNQENAAMLLGISRSQWSMYESGKRNLPLAAKNLLAAILEHLQMPEAIAKRSEFIDNDATHQQYEQLLRENEYQRLLVAKKITATGKKRDIQFRRVQLANFLASRDTETVILKSLHEVLTAKGSNISPTSLSNWLVELKDKQKILDFEKSLLESELQKTLSTNSNKESQ